MIYFFTSCHGAIRTLPALQHDSHRIEDVDTSGNDHCADSIRYACASRPWVRDAPQKPAAPSNVRTIQGMIDRYESQLEERRRI